MLRFKDDKTCIFETAKTRNWLSRYWWWAWNAGGIYHWIGMSNVIGAESDFVARRGHFDVTIKLDIDFDLLLLIFRLKVSSCGALVCNGS